MWVIAFWKVNNYVKVLSCDFTMQGAQPCEQTILNVKYEANTDRFVNFYMFEQSGLPLSVAIATKLPMWSKQLNFIAPWCKNSC